MWMKNTETLVGWLRDAKRGALALAPGFILDGEAFEKAKAEVMRQHPDEIHPDSRAAYRLLTTPKESPKMTRRPQRTKERGEQAASPAISFDPQVFAPEKFGAALKDALSGITKLEPKVELSDKHSIPKWLKIGFGIGILLLLSVIAARGQTVVFKDEGTVRVRRAGGQVGIDFVGAGVACGTPTAGVITCTITSGGGGSWSDLTDPTAVTVFNSGAVPELFQLNYAASYGATDVLLDVKQLTGNPLAGSILARFTVNDPDMLPLVISDGTNNVFMVERDADTTIRNFLDQNLILVIDSGSTATQNGFIEFRDRTTMKYQMGRGDTNNFFLWDGVRQRLNFGSGGVNQYRTGGAGQDHHFYDSGATIRVQLLEDDDRSCWGATDNVACLGKTTDPNSEVAVNLSGTSTFGLPVISADPNTATWGTGQDGRIFFQSTANVPRIWDGAAIQEFSLLGQTIEPAEVDLTAAYNWTGDHSFNPSGLGGLTDYDISVGDTDGTPTYGVVRMGDAIIGRVSFISGSLDLDGAIMIRNVGGAVTNSIEYAFADSSNNVRFALATTGSDLGSYSPRSLIIAGPAPANSNMVNCDTWTTTNTNIDCDTSATGADLFVQDDLEVEGLIYAWGGVISASGDPADAGYLRLANTETIAWELATPGVDMTFSVSANDKFTLGTLDCSAGDQYLTTNASGEIDCGTDDSAGSPTLDSIADPVAATDWIFGTTTETLLADFQAAFTTGPQIEFKQSTGNPSGGTLVRITVPDPDVTPFVIHDGTNPIFTVAQDGTVTVGGTGPGLYDMVTGACTTGNAGEVRICAHTGNLLATSENAGVVTEIAKVNSTPAADDVSGSLAAGYTVDRVNGVPVAVTTPADGECWVYDGITDNRMEPGSCGAGGSHAILSATHSDTTAAAVVRGDVMVGKTATPVWQRHAVGTNLQFLGNDGTDVVWEAVNFTDLSGSATAGQVPNLESLNGTLDIGSGGTGQTTANPAFNALSPVTTEGDLIFRNATVNARLARGSDGQCLLSNTTTILWGSCGGGGAAWDTLTAPTGAVTLPSDGITELFKANFTANYGATDVLVQFEQLTGNPVAGSTLFRLVWADGDILPMLFSGPVTAQAAMLIDMDQPSVTGQRDSHSIDITGTAFDGSGHDADWRIFVDVTGDQGNSELKFQERVDAASFVTAVRFDRLGNLTTTGNVSATGDLSFQDSTGVFGSFDHSNTSARVWSLPDVTGTIALIATASAAGDISGSVSAGYNIDAGSVASAELATANKTFKCNFTLFDENNLADTDDIETISNCSRPGRAITITEVIAETDAGSPVINLQRDDGSPANLLSSNCTATTGGTTCSIDAAEDNFAATDKLDFVAVSAMSGATRVSILITYTVD